MNDALPPAHPEGEPSGRRPARWPPPYLWTSERDPFHVRLGIRVEEQNQGYSRVALETSNDTSGGVSGAVHGGVLATMVDIAAVSAIASLVEPEREQMAGTAELNISFLRPAFAAVVVAEGRVLKKGRSLAVVDVDCSDGKGRLFAKGRVQYALRPLADGPRTDDAAS